MSGTAVTVGGGGVPSDMMGYGNMVSVFLVLSSGDNKVKTELRLDVASKQRKEG